MAAETFRTTIDESVLITDSQDRPLPGLVVIFSGGQPQCQPIRLDTKPIVLGRFPADDVVVVDDDRISRRHTRVALKNEGVRVTDLESRNGTFVDAQRVTDETMPKLPRILRLGQSLLLVVADLRPYLTGGVEVFPDEVVGPVLRRVRQDIARGAESGDSLLLTGPSGAGKELAARAFHVASGAKGAFVAVNCATIPTGLAERLLFGARKGTYSGATADSEGYVQAADGGTLFLDEVAELDVAVQPKLLRVLEQHEVVSLGASHPRKVDVRVCAATLKDLRAEVNAGRFREDLYYRIGRPEVRLPSLLERLEDMPWLIVRELLRVDAKLTPHPSLIEACALRPWPGNVRELLGEIRRAGRDALADGRAAVKDRDLPQSAGAGDHRRQAHDVVRARERRGGGDARGDRGRAAGRAGQRDAGGAGAGHAPEPAQAVDHEERDRSEDVRRGGIDDDATGEGDRASSLPED